MNVRDGYKMTELGEIPSEWDVGFLADYSVRVKVGFVGTCNKYYCSSQIGIPMIRTTNISENGIDESELKYVTSDFHTKNAKSQLKKGDILVARHGNNGHACMFDKNYPANCLNVVVIEPDNSKLFNYYLIQIFNSDILKKQIADSVVGSVQGVINTSSIARLLLPIPYIVEQNKIADILSTVDEHISETESLIEKTKVLKQGMMQHLLTKGIGHTEFKDTEIGRIPVEWEVVDFGSLCSSRNIKCQPTTSEVKKYIALEHMDQGSGRLLSYGSSCGSISIKTEFFKNDVLFGKLRPYLKKYWLAQFDGVCSTEILAFKSNNKALPLIILYFVEQDSFVELATGKSYGTKMPRASWGDIKVIKVPLIPLCEQHKIASILSSIDNQIDIYQTKLTSLNKLKSSLMQQLLTGKTRVKVC